MPGGWADYNAGFTATGIGSSPYYESAERTAMERLTELLERIRKDDLANGHLRGCLHVLIGRTIKTTDGEPVSVGNTWRDLSLMLKSAKFDKELVRELGADPESISPRDRERFWYSAIALARPDTAEAIADAEAFIAKIAPLGYQVGPLPTGLVGTQPIPAVAVMESSPKSKKKK